MKPLDVVGKTASTGILFPGEWPFLCHQILTGFHRPNLANLELRGVGVDDEGWWRRGGASAGGVRPRSVLTSSLLCRVQGRN